MDKTRYSPTKECINLVTIDIWQMVGSIAGFAFSVGFVEQVRMTYRTRNVDGLSLAQWLVFACASGIFTAYYAHLEQWLMVLLSVFGTLCCLIMLVMIRIYRQTVE